MKKNSKIVSVLAVFFAVMTLSSCMNAIMGSMMGMYYFEGGDYELILTESSSQAGGSIMLNNKTTGSSVASLFDGDTVEFAVGNTFSLSNNYEVEILSKKEVRVYEPGKDLWTNLKRGDITKWAMSHK